MNPENKTEMGTILIVDDDKGFRESLFRLHQVEWYAVLQADSGTQGLRRFREYQDEIDVVVVDMVMPRNVRG